MYATRQKDSPTCLFSPYFLNHYRIPWDVKIFFDDASFKVVLLHFCCVCSVARVRFSGTIIFIFISRVLAPAQRLNLWWTSPTAWPLSLILKCTRRILNTPKDENSAKEKNDFFSILNTRSYAGCFFCNLNLCEYILTHLTTAERRI